MSLKRPNNFSKSIAVAGGTGGVGSHIVEELLRTNRFDVVLLLRKDNPSVVARLQKQFPRSAERLHPVVISYSDPATLADVFAKYTVDTVISTLPPSGEKGMEIAQRALLTASEQVPSVRRFSPSDWANGLSETDNMLARLYAPKWDIIPLLRDSSLNWQGFSTGIFMDYMFSGAPPREVDGELRSPTGHLNPLKFIIDVENAKVNIPVLDDGKESPVVFTRIDDVGKYVAQACLLDEAGWTEGQGRMLGWRGTYSEVVKIAERITGKTFEVTRTPVSIFKASIDTSLPPMQTFFAEGQAAMAEGAADWEEDVLGAELQRHGLGFTPKNVEESLAEWWGPRS